MERKSIFPLLLSPVLSSSNFKSPPRPRTSKPGPASKTGRMKAGSRSIIGTQTVSSKLIKVHKCDRNLSNQTKERSDDPQEIERLTVKKEKPDDGRESRLSPAFDDVRNDETSNVAKTDNSIQTCPSCNKEFSKKGRLQAHISQAHPNHYIHYKCPHCDWSTTNRGSLRSHIVTSHRDKVDYYTCNHCSQNFTNLASCKKHRRSCGNEVNTDGHKERKGHVVSSGVNKIKAFQSNGVKKTRASPSTHTCLDCFTSFSSRLNLVKHKLSCNATPYPNHVCCTCNQQPGCLCYYNT